jgi:hypothetical protein
MTIRGKAGEVLDKVEAIILATIPGELKHFRLIFVSFPQTTSGVAGRSDDQSSLW